MRIIKKSRDNFFGSHKGSLISIERERDGRFYIVVHDEAGLTSYAGWAPLTVTTMAEAKREAIKGACL